jgi:hypothetical protein
LNEAASSVRIFRVGALRENDANRFHQCHGCVEVSNDEWDIAYERPRHPAPG